MTQQGVVGFLTLIEQSNLLDSSELAKLKSRYSNPASDVTAVSITDALVAESKLTRWQADNLLNGHISFFLGKYKLLQLIGRGGMGTVFQAEQQGMSRIVALKVMDNRLARDPSVVARFHQEIQAAAAMHHPHLITAYDADHVGDNHFLVMEFVQGEDLGDALKRQPVLPVSVACEYVRQAALGLQYVYEK